jgi:hypothetical protein
MHLVSYVCEMCILQREESLGHLFFRCNFFKKLLGSDWHHCPLMAASSKSDQKAKEIFGSSICHGNYNSNVLGHLDRAKYLDLQQ